MSAYFMCDPAAASYNGVVNACRNKHTQEYPGANLSIAQDPGLTRSVIKVYNSGKGLVNQPAVLTAYDDSEHGQLMLDMAAIAPLDQWSNPP